jgi:hypothetical protein
MVSNEEALDRAEAEDQAARREAAAHLLDGGVLLWSKRRHDGCVVRVDASRPPVSSQRLGADVALLAFGSIRNFVCEADLRIMP